MKNSLLLFMAGLTLLLIWREAENRGANSRLKLENKKLEDSNKRLTTELKSIVLVTKEVAATRPEEDLVESESSPAIENKQNRNEEGSSDRRQLTSDYGLADIERFTVLEPDQRRQVESLLETAAEKVRDGDENVLEYYNEGLERVIGTDLFKSLSQAKKDEQEKRINDRIEQEVYTYARKLGLAQDQELELSRVISQARNDFFPQGQSFWQGMMFKTAEARQFAIREYFATREKMKESISASVQGFLTDDQYNLYLEIENDGAANSIHRQMLNNQKK